MKPKHIPQKEWDEAIKRARRAKTYADMFPNLGSETFQDALWQWENEVRGRFGGVVGGSLSGTRDQRS